MSNYYSSATHGRIPLSVTVKYLMHRLRCAVVRAIGTGDYNADRQAIAHACGEIALYMSKLENPIHYFQPRDIYKEAYKTMDITEATRSDLQDRADAISTDVEAVKKRTISVVATHGREAVLAVLKQFGAVNVSDLTLGKLHAYCYVLEKLATTPTTAQCEDRKLDIVFRAVQARVDANWNGTSTLNGRDRTLFEAGREFERNKS